jgi:hypothetical protein
VTVVLLPSLGCRMLMTDVSLGYCGVGGASLATRLDAGKRHAVWWTDCCGGIYEKTRFSSMAETGFSAVFSQALDAPVVLSFMSPLPEGQHEGYLLSRLTSIGVTPLPYQSRYDAVLTSLIVHRERGVDVPILP